MKGDFKNYFVRGNRNLFEFVKNHEVDLIQLDTVNAYSKTHFLLECDLQTVTKDPEQFFDDLFTILNALPELSESAVLKLKEKISFSENKQIMLDNISGNDFKSKITKYLKESQKIAKNK